MAMSSTSGTSEPAAVIETYFDAWLNQDVDRLRSILADDVTFDPRPLLDAPG
jgi:hypothetical protein